MGDFAKRGEDAKEGFPPYAWCTGPPPTGGADAPALGFISQRKKEAQTRARFGRGDQCFARPRVEHAFFQSEMKPAGRGGARRMACSMPDVISFLLIDSSS